jgi:hypothetical protein
LLLCCEVTWPSQPAVLTPFLPVASGKEREQTG